MQLSKQCRIVESEPRALTKLGLDKNDWTTRVKGISSGYWCFVGEWQELLEKAKDLKLRTIFDTVSFLVIAQLDAPVVRTQSVRTNINLVEL